MIAGSLEIQLLADIARLQQDMDKASSVVGGAMGKISSSVSTATKLLGGLATGLSVAAFSGWIRGAIDAADAASKLSAKTGVAVKDLAGLQLAYSLGGAEGDAFAKSMTKLSVAMVEGNKGLAQLGIKTKTVSGEFLSTKDVLYSVADLFSNLEDGAFKTAKAVEIFGKSGADLIPLLNGGSAAFKEMDAMAQRLGLTISESTAKRAEEFNDTLELVRLGSQGVARGIAAELLPTLTNLATSFLGSMTEGDKLKNTADFLANGLKILYSVAVGVVEIFSTLGKTIGATTAAIVATLSGDFKLAASIAREASKDIGNGWLDSAKAISTAWEGSANVVVLAQAKLMKSTKFVTEDMVTAVKAVSQVKDEFEKLYAKIQGKDQGVDSDYEKNLTILNRAYEEEILTLDEYMKLVLKYNSQQKVNIDLAKKEADEIEALKNAINKQNDSAKSMLATIQFETKLLGLNSIQRAEANALRQLESAGVVEGTEAYINYAEAIKEASIGKVIVEEQIKANSDQLADTKKMWESVDKTAHDVFVSIFNGGKSAFDRLRDTLKSGLLDMLYQMTVKKWVLNIASNITGGGGSLLQAAGSSSSGGGSMLSSVGSLLGSGGAIGNFAGGFTSGLSSFSSLTATGGNLSAGFTALGAGNIAGGLGSLAGTLGPYALAAVAISQIIKNTKGETRGGGQYGYSFDGTVQNNRRPGLSVNASPGSVAFLEGPSGGELGGDAVRTAIAATVQGINATLKAVGSSAALTGFQAALETSGKGRGGVFAGGMLNTGVAFGESGSGDNYRGTLFEKSSSQSPDAKTALANFSLDLKQATIQALQAAVDLPKSISEQLRGINAESLADDATNKLLDTINSQIVAVTEFRDAIATLPFAGLRDLSFDTADALLKFTGGIQGISSQLASFDKNFYSEAERATKQSEEVTKQMTNLGFSSIKTKEEFRSLIEGMSVTDEASAKTFAGLLAVSDAFAQVSDRANDSAKAIAEAQAQAAVVAEAQAAKASADAAQANKDALIKNANDAFSALQRSVDAQKKILQDAYNDQSKLLRNQSQIATSSLQNIKSVFTLLSSSLSSLVPLSRSAGKGILNNALSLSNAGGSLKDFPGLSDALQAVAKPSEDLFVSFADWQKDQKLTANTVSQLKDNAGAQVGVAELTLNAINDTIKVLDENHATDILNLNRTIELAKSQINAINKVDDSVVSMHTALSNLADAVLGIRKTGPSTTSSNDTSPEIQSAKLNDDIKKYASNSAKDSYYFIPGVNDFNAKMQNAKNLSKQLGSFDPAKFGTAELALLNTTGRDVKYWKDVQNQFDAGLGPRASFAVGTNFVRRDMDARIHAGERIMPAADNRELMQRLRDPSKGELLEELRATREDNRQMRMMMESHLYAIAKGVKMTSESLDDVIVGGRSIKTTAA